MMIGGNLQLREMLTEAVRNTQPEPKRLSKTKKIAASSVN
jgi:hypothetical protein